MSPSELSLPIPMENICSHPNYKPLGGGEKKETVVFTCLNVSESTHTSQDSAIDGIKVERDRRVSQGDLVETTSLMAVRARGV